MELGNNTSPMQRDAIHLSGLGIAKKEKVSISLCKCCWFDSIVALRHRVTIWRPVELIQLEHWPKRQPLYWTDRDECPLGRTLDMAYAGSSSASVGAEESREHRYCTSSEMFLQCDWIEFRNHESICPFNRSGIKVYRFNMDDRGKRDL